MNRALSAILPVGRIVRGFEWRGQWTAPRDRIRADPPKGLPTGYQRIRAYRAMVWPSAKFLAWVSGAAKTLGDLTHVKLVHLVLQSAKRDAKVFGRPGDIPPALLQAPENEVALEGVGGF